MKTITRYADFWPYYLREHAEPSTRAWHYVGTGVAIIVLVAVILTGQWLFLPLAFVSGYFFAWMSHGLIEKNKPATFTYPLWSLFSDFKMLFCFLTGRMGRELDKAGVSSTQRAE
ncbi:MAG: Mpo1-like protein [Litorimonas sp.]